MLFLVLELSLGIRCSGNEAEFRPTTRKYLDCHPEVVQLHSRLLQRIMSILLIRQFLYAISSIMALSSYYDNKLKSDELFCNYVSQVTAFLFVFR